MVSFSNIIFILVIVQYVQGSNLFSYVNLEKYFYIEEEMISLSNAIVEIERKSHSEEDVHKIFHHSRIIDQAKRIHLDVIEYEDYLAHPINVFHLTKRLTKDWRDMVASLLKSSICVNDLKVKLMNIEDNLPSEDDFNNITYAVLGLQDFQDYSMYEIMDGTVNGVKPHEPLVLEDAMDFGLCAYTKGLYDRAIDWLEFVVDENGKSTDDIGRHTVGKLYSNLATVYLRIGDIDNALETNDRFLELVPDSKIARQNKEHFKMKKSRNEMTKEHRNKVSKFTRLRVGLCSGEISITNKKTKGRTVSLDTWDDSVLTRKYYYDAKMIRRRPLIVVVPGVISEDVTSNISTLGYYKMFQKAVTSNKYGNPKFRVRVNDSSGPFTMAVQEDLSQIKLTRYRPQRTKFEVLNAGLDGINSEGYTQKYPISFAGTMLAALSDSSLGGEVVFPYYKTILKLNKGDVVFYEAGAVMSICPVMYATNWYGTTEVWQSVPNRVCGHQDRVIKIG